MRHKSLGLAVALASIAGLAAFSAAWGAEAPDASRNALAMPGDSAPWGISLPSTKARAPYTIGGIPVCLRSGQAAVIDDVKATGAQDEIQVTNFVVRPLSDELFGAEQVRLSDAGVVGGHRVDAACSREPGGAELVVEMQKARPGNARIAGLNVTYSTAGRKGSLQVPLHLVLCQAADQETPDCEALPR
jgi:hypothetical protein